MPRERPRECAATMAEIEYEWIHLTYSEHSQYTETYGFAGGAGSVNLEGVFIRPRGRPSRTLLIFMHPASTLQLMPLPRALAAHGAHVLCAGSRFARNDTAAILEKVVLDLGAYIHHAKLVREYEKIVLVGWSGGGSLALMYQAQAEIPTITHTPAGDPVAICEAGLIAADAVIFQAAHISRARLLADTIDPSIKNENNPDDRDSFLDLYDRQNPNQPPYSHEFIVRFREAQLERMNRITETVRETLLALKLRAENEVERGFVTHRTLADPRFLDKFIDPNGRRIGWCYLGLPETVNNGPVGLARFSTLRAWLSQWSLADTNADGLANAARLKAPLLVIENGADDAVPQPHTKMIFDVASSTDKSFHVIKGATHYYLGQDEKLIEVVSIILTWLRNRCF